MSKLEVDGKVIECGVGHEDVFAEIDRASRFVSLGGSLTDVLEALLRSRNVEVGGKKVHVLGVIEVDGIAKILVEEIPVVKTVDWSKKENVEAFKRALGEVDND